MEAMSSHCKSCANCPLIKNGDYVLVTVLSFLSIILLNSHPNYEGYVLTFAKKNGPNSPSFPAFTLCHDLQVPWKWYSLFPYPLYLGEPCDLLGGRRYKTCQELAPFCLLSIRILSNFHTDKPGLALLDDERCVSVTCLDQLTASHASGAGPLGNWRLNHRHVNELSQD